MRDRSLPYAIAASAILASAGLHLLAVAATGFAGFAVPLLAVSVFYVLVGLGLLRSLRWLAYIAFLCMLIGGNGALIELGQGRFPDVWMIAIALADAVAAAALFVALWRGSDAGATAQ